MDKVDRLLEELTEVRRKLVEVERERERLRDEELEIVQSLSNHGHVSEIAEKSIDSQRNIRLTPIIRKILRESPNPHSRKDIVDELAARDITASEDAVSASLSYLKKQESVQHFGGLWVWSND